MKDGDGGERKQDGEIEVGLGDGVVRDGFKVGEKPKTWSKHDLDDKDKGDEDAHDNNDNNDNDNDNDNEKTPTRGYTLTPVHPSIDPANAPAQARVGPPPQTQAQPPAHPVPIAISTSTSNSEPDTSSHVVPSAQTQTQTQTHTRTQTQAQELPRAFKPRVTQPTLTPTPTPGIKTTSTSTFSGGPADADGASGRRKSLGLGGRGGLGEDRAGLKGRAKNSVERDSPGNPFIQRGTPASTSTSLSGNPNVHKAVSHGTSENTNAATSNSDFGRKLQGLSSSSIHNNHILAEIDKDNNQDNDDSAFHDTLNGRRRFSARSALSRGEDSIFEAQPGDGSRMVDDHGHGYGAELEGDVYDPAFEFRTSWEVLRNSVYSLVEDGKMFHLLPTHLACDRCISESLIDRPNCKIVIPNELDPAVLHEAMSSASAHREACTACLYAHESCSFQAEDEAEGESEKEEESEREPEPVMDTMAELTQGTLSMMTDNNDAESTFTHAFEGVFENSIRQYYNDPRRETYETCKANLKLVDGMAKGQAGEDEVWIQRYRQRLGNCVKDWKAKDRV
ncbi:hypothetical protein FFLO_06755 [Filobasidium floriforme]|uniref:Uncharacterized protein n=1 Tax=Filobasidium floriforme TaxID=5210 RepID=A0A8K0JET1_9TREE|nr:hypothetical protein FFLO_06755 [Filobasidium floriforme]